MHDEERKYSEDFFLVFFMDPVTTATRVSKYTRYVLTAFLGIHDDTPSLGGTDSM